MDFELDNFNGIILSAETVPNSNDAFASELREVLGYATDNRKNLIWLTLPIDQSHLIAEATAQGFTFHNCEERTITLIHKPKPDTFVPFIPTHTVGAGALIQNDQQEILLIKEHGMQGYKLPGGHVELGEPIGESVVREVWEETGVTAEFESILGITTKHPFQFGKSNMYIVCKLTATEETINIQDVDEIAEAKWVPVNEFLQDEVNYPFNRQMVGALLNQDGLALVELAGNTGRHKKQETFFAQTSSAVHSPLSLNSEPALNLMPVLQQLFIREAQSELVEQPEINADALNSEPFQNWLKSKCGFTNQDVANTRWIKTCTGGYITEVMFHENGTLDEFRLFDRFQTQGTWQLKHGLLEVCITKGDNTYQFTIVGNQEHNVHSAVEHKNGELHSYLKFAQVK